MKRLASLIFAAILSVTFSFANDKGIVVGAMFGDNRSSNAHTHKDQLNFNIRAGYSFNAKWEATLKCGSTHFGDNRGDDYVLESYGAYGRYKYLRIAKELISLYVDLESSTMTCKIRLAPKGSSHHQHSNQFTQIGFIPGAALNIPGCGFGLHLEYMFFGFNDIGFGYSHNAGCFSSNNFMADFGVRRLMLGVSYRF